jgi:hypothetical protein
MKKQTAVEWLEAEIIALENYSLKELRLLFNQAKAMEKEQIIDTYNKAAAFTLLQIGEQYYNETYGK